MTNRPGAADLPRRQIARRPRSGTGLFVLAFGVCALVAVFIGLGIWQLERRTWKLDLIARVDERVHAAPVPAPGPDQWPSISAAKDEYRHVTVRGTFRNDTETLVQAVTERGSGFWVLTPFQTTDGFDVLVNRGFVPTEMRDPASRAAGQRSGETVVTGLLRVSEPKGGFLRSNDPAGDRWFSRDVAAIGEARQLSNLAPYFIDADATPNPGGVPVGGLTVVSFRNTHLVYALTWFGMAVLMVVGGVILFRDERRVRRNYL